MKKSSPTGLITNLSHIRRVDIELHSFCNRTCDWCPNKTYLRNKQIKMEDWVFDKIVNELKEFEFGPERSFINDRLDELNQYPFLITPFTENQPGVTLMGYMEPMSDIKLLKQRVKQLKDELPGHVEISSSTSGDYLSKKNLDGLFLTRLNIMDYDHKGEEYWIEQLRQSKCLIVDDRDVDYNGIIAIHKNIGLITVKTNWKEQVSLEDRAGILKQNESVIKDLRWANNKEKRIVPCPEPSYFINITYDGSVMPCCHLRSDVPMHKDYILGNVKEHTLLEILNSDKAVEFRQKLTVERGDYPTPCKTCQKIRKGNCSGGPNDFKWIDLRYEGNQINESIQI